MGRGRSTKLPEVAVPTPISPLDPLGLTLDDGKTHAQLNGVLSGLGMTADTEVTILSDGADGPRSLGEAASTGTVYHVLDWFHLAMRI